ncbi:hypothetical protein EPUL_002798 [Erysiphe pulchra]|uniref:Transposase Tc1-like domain-containing protein n=1 Tax=Erysiphe pulchra TaxID=225359 RepID=A0A2S4PRD6_9PEZI|nr:hypothetical protein EPUL_002798 [Erysiphe pulchra]
MNSSQISPSTSQKKHLSRDQSLLIYGLRDAGKSHDEIASQLKISLCQVGHALRRGKVTPRKRNGRLPIFSSDDVDEIENFVRSSLMNRKMTYLELATGPFRYLGVSERIIQSELRKRGYRRHPAHKKPPVSEQTKTIRKEWAEAHVYWTVESWISILWTDETETWVKDSEHSGEWITRKNTTSTVLVKQ